MSKLGQDAFISMIERLHPSKHVIFRISKLSPKSNVDQSGKRRTQSQTLLQNRGTGLNGKESSVLLFEESARFSIEVSFTNPVNSNSTCKLPSEEHFKT